MASSDDLLRRALGVMREDPGAAAAICKLVLDGDSTHGDAKLVLSEALRRLGNLDGAHELVAPLAAASPKWFGAQRQLGVILAEKGAHLPASLALRAAADAQPVHPTIWRDLAEQLALAGDGAAAAAAYARHGAQPMLEPRLVQVAGMLAANDAGAAKPLLEAFLRDHPNDVAALRLQAEMQARSDRPDLAEATLRRGLAIAPDYNYLRHALGQLLMGLGRLEEAMNEVSTLLRRDSENPGSLRLNAAVHVAMGEHETAAGVYERLLQNDSSRAPVWTSYGHVLKTLGRSDEAVAAFRRSIELAPQLGTPYWSLANLKTVTFSEADVAQMEAALVRSDISDADRVELHFALGKACEDAKRHDDAFGHYEEGARLHRRHNRYEAGGLSEFVSRSKAKLTAAFFEERTGCGALASDAIFIVGLPRAGSTLLEQVLASHSMVEGTSELTDLDAIAQSIVGAGERLVGLSYVDLLTRQDRTWFARAGETYLRTTRQHRKLGRPLFINKMPNDFMHVGLIHLILPNAKVIDARRHPMACGWSCFKQHFALGQNFSYDLEDIGRYYADYVRLMAHYDVVLPGRVHRVIHEHFVADPEPHIRALLDYCCLPFEEACLRPHETKRAVNTASAEQVRRPISAKGLDDWRAYEPWLAPLKRALGPVLDAYPGAPK
jgi:tetratricopeptide (TPR) repeat protein